MVKKILGLVFCGIVFCSTGRATIYSRGEGLETLARNLIANLDEKLENAAALDFVNLDGRVTMLGKYVAEQMSVKLAKFSEFKIIERALIDKVISEQKYNLSDFVDTKKAVNFGKLIGAKGIITGVITELENSFQVNARIIRTETGEVLSISTVEIKKDLETTKLANQIIPAKIEKVEKPKEEKKEEVKKVEEKIAPEKPQEPKGEKIFYFEDFSTIKEGDIPNGWVGGERLMVKSSERQKFLTPFESGEHHFTVTGIKFPKDFEFQWVINSRAMYRIKISDIEVEINPWANNGISYYENFRMNQTKKSRGVAYTKEGKIAEVSLKKIGSVFRLLVDGEEILMGRYPDFKTPDRFIFEVPFSGSFKLYKVIGIDLTE